MRKNAPRLVNPLDGHNQQTLKNLGIPTARERALADQRARKADPSADKPKKVAGNIDDGTYLESLGDILHRQGVIDNKPERGGHYGDQLHNSTLVNANSPIFLVAAEGNADTASTTNTVNTVAAQTLSLDLGVGKWAVSVLGSVVLTHDSGGTVAVSVEINSVEGTARLVSSAAAPGVRCAAHLNQVDEVNWIQGEQTINCRLRYRCNSSGTTSAKNPELFVLARRME
jgi:hypothetical protein